MAKKRERHTGVIDPVYKKYVDTVQKNMGEDEFYKYFMTNLAGGKRTIQFSNRRLEKKIDKEWIIAVEACIEPFRNIILNPRNFIIEEEEIVNIAVARQSTPDVLRHLTTHGQYIDEIDEDHVRPNHLLNKFKEESWNTYENRFCFTLLEKTTEFVNKRFNAIFDNMEGEFGAFLKVQADSKNDTDTLSASFDIRIRQNEDYLADDEESMSIFERLRRINEDLRIFNSSQFAQIMRAYPRVKNPIVKTNAIQKNPNFKACYKLWVFLYAYHDIGYEINIYEQSTLVTPDFEHDVNNSVFNGYLILKNYLEEKSDRLIDTTKPYTKRVLKPKYIKKIIEELVKNFDISDTEIRKVLIEEFTKAQLEQLEEKERRALVEQREREKMEKRRREAEAKKREQDRKQRERAKRLKAKEAELAKRQKLHEKRLALIEKLIGNLTKELERFEKGLEKGLKERYEYLEEQNQAFEIKESPKMFYNLDNISSKFDDGEGAKSYFDEPIEKEDEFVLEEENDVEIDKDADIDEALMIFDDDDDDVEESEPESDEDRIQRIKQDIIEAEEIIESERAEQARIQAELEAKKAEEMKRAEEAAIKAQEERIKSEADRQRIAEEAREEAAKKRKQAEEQAMKEARAALEAHMARIAAVEELKKQESIASGRIDAKATEARLKVDQEKKEKSEKEAVDEALKDTGSTGSVIDKISDTIKKVFGSNK